jgi:hypothetical protein
MERTRRNEEFSLRQIVVSLCKYHRALPIYAVLVLYKRFRLPAVISLLRNAMKKLPKKYAGVLFSLYASAVMVLIVSGVLVALNTGIDAGYPLRLLKAYLITWPVAFASLLLVRPLVVKWVAASITD